jgi:hypothetical protein
MADQKNRGGQKQGRQEPGQTERKQAAHTRTPAGRSDQDKRQDQMSNPDDAGRRATNEQR